MNKKIMLTLGGVWVLGSLFKRPPQINISNNNQSAANVAADIRTSNVMIDRTKPRGIRNNNPANIKHGSDRWQGMAAQQYDPTFVVFNNAHYGLRALARVLKTYKRKHGINTVQGIVKRFSATDQAAYIKNMASALGVTATQSIDIEQNLYKIMAAIIKQENGYNPYSPNEIQAAIAAA